MILSTTISGAERIMLDYVIYMSENFQSMDLILYKGQLSEEVKKYSNIKVHLINSKRHFKVIGEIRSIVDRNSIEVLHCHDNKASVLGYFATCMSKNTVKVVSHVHNTYPFLRRKTFTKLFDTFMRKRYSGNIFCTSLVYDYYKKHSRQTNNYRKRIVLENSTLVERNEEMSKSSLCDERLETFIGANDIVLGFIGRFEEQKGLIPFLNACLEYGIDDKLKIVLIGMGSLYDQIIGLVDDLPKNFLVMKYKANVFPYLSRFDYLILPSKFEGLPIVLLESMSLGVPGICMEVGGISNLVTKETGFLVEQDNYFEFVKTINETVELSEQKYHMLSVNSKELISKYYSIKEYSHRLLEYYNEI